MRRGQRPAVRVAAAVGLALLTACGSGATPTVPPLPVSSPVGPTSTPSTLSSMPSMPSTPPPAPGAGFVPCDDGLECATLLVPVDYANPTGPTIGLGLVRRPARDQAHKLGVLLVNPGGPGGSGIETVERGTVPDAVADRYDVIGFDPRGVGRSEGLDCPVGPDAPYAGDPDPGDPADEAATNAAVDRYIAGCQQRYGALLPHLGTRNVARDMDAIRQFLGQPRTSYLGFSYGTAIGQVYAQMFPQHIRAMVLDGVVDLSRPGLDSAQAVSFENSLRQFAADCRRRPTCPVRQDPIGVVDRAQQRLAAAPLPVPGSSPLSAGLFEIGLSLPLYSQDTWPVLARALGALETGNGAPMRRLADAYFQSSNSDTYNAVTCLDNAWPLSDAQVLASSRATEAVAPHFSGNVMVSGLTCADWPVPQQPLQPIRNYTGPPLLVIGTTNDPATPYLNSVALQRSLPGSALLTYRGEGHTAYGGGVPCVDDQVNRYLVDGTLPTTPVC